MQYRKYYLPILLIFSLFEGNGCEMSNYSWLRPKTLQATLLDSTFAVAIGGIKQYIQIKTLDTTRPVLLFLAGGPGGSMMNSKSKAYTNKLLDRFTIVQWDQRGAGKTLAHNPAPKGLSLSQMQRDTYEVVVFLLKYLKKEKIYLAGHSFGNVLGFNMVEHHPELLYGYLAINPVISQLESEKLLIIRLQNFFKDHPQATKELSLVRIPFERTQDLYLIRKWLFVMDGQAYVRSHKFRSFFMDWAERWFEPWQELMAIDLTKSLTKINCPVYFFVGKDDIQTATLLSQRYFEMAKAPKKALYMFEHSKHTVFETESKKFQDIIIQEILLQDFP